MHMNTKTLLAALAAGATSFLMGWLVYGMALMSYMNERTTRAALKIMRPEPEFLYLILGSLAAGLWMAWILQRMGVNTVKGGLVAGAIIAGLIALNYDLMFHAMMIMYKGRMMLLVDIGASAVIGGVVGAVAGAVLGTGQKATA